MKARLAFGAALGAAVAAGCYLGNGPPGSNGDQPGTSSNPSPTAGGSPATAGDLPCDVASLLEAKCTSCHSSPPVGGAPMSLVSYADLTATSLSDPSKTFAEQSVVRMQSSTSPMPPGGGASSLDVQTMQAWISAGYPHGSCDGGAASTNDYDTPVVCTSGQYNTSNDGSSRMRPGNACIGCHAQSGGEAPRFSIAGTVYPTAHEPNDCVGVESAAAQVVIMDTNGNATLTLTTNSAGNFSSSANVPSPYRAKVVSNGKERAMSASQTSGDCNSCHTESGQNGAPGRIMLPN